MLDARGRGIHHIFKLVSAMQLVKKTAQLTTFNVQSGGGGGVTKQKKKARQREEILFNVFIVSNNN